jgi:hypothetical protein
MRNSPNRSAAYGLTVRASVALLRQFNVEIEQLEAELTASFEGHPDAEILCSLHLVVEHRGGSAVM